MLHNTQHARPCVCCARAVLGCSAHLPITLGPPARGAHMYRYGLRYVCAVLHQWPELRMQCRTGGHTSEMMGLLGALDFSKYHPRVYVVANTDGISASKVQAFEQAHALSRINVWFEA